MPPRQISADFRNTHTRGARMRKGMNTKASFEVEARRQQVARLYLGKATQEEIAQRLGVNQCTISRDVSALMDRWKQEAALEVGTIRAREVAEIEELERVCAERFQDQPDPRWIAERRLLKTRKAKLLGLDVPVPETPQKAPVFVTQEERDQRMQESLARLGISARRTPTGYGISYESDTEATKDGATPTP